MSARCSRTALGARQGLAAIALLLGVCAAERSDACVGVDCMLTWSTAEGGGALTLEFDFAHKKVQTFKVFCASGTCLYSVVNPGFMNSTDPPPDGYYALADGTAINVEIVSIDPAVTLKVNSSLLKHPGESASIGTTPELHTHPSWQLNLPEGQQGDYPLSFKLTTDSPRYTESQVFSILVSNLPTPTPNAPTPTATPTPTAPPALPACPGDCDDSGAVSIDELVLGVSSALDGQLHCPACDRDRDGKVEISELVGAVNAALQGCPATPTPIAATFEAIEQALFAPRCAIPTCHTAQARSGDLALDADHAYGELVGVEPFIDSARVAGLLRVAPNHPENSFLLVKLEGPPVDQGSRMPLTGPLLSDAEVQLIRDWIAHGAQP